MLVRTGLATVLMLSVVVLAVTVGSLETLSSPFGRFVFGLLATTYLASLAYAISLRRIQDPVRFADIQIGVDLVLITLLVHATGGAQSGYTFLYLVDVVAVVSLPKGFGAASVSAAAALLYVSISLLGYLKVLPPHHRADGLSLGSHPRGSRLPHRGLPGRAGVRRLAGRGAWPGSGAR